MTTASASSRVLAEWASRVAAEYTSAAVAAQVLHLAIQVGLPDAVHRAALRVVGDELDHARLSHEALVALGGADLPVALDVERLARPQPDGPLAALVDAVVRDFCLGETLAVPLFDAMRRHTADPAVRPVLERVLRDEAAHRAFGWSTLDALLTLDAAGVRARVSARLPGWLAGFDAAYGRAPDAAPPLAEAERAQGLLDGATYRRVHAETVRDEILPRMARRGIAP